MARYVTLVLSLGLLSTGLYAQQGLAPAVQADLLRNQIIAQAKANNEDGVLAALEQYHKLVDANRLEFPVPLYWIEAKAAHDTGDSKRALSSLTQFLNMADHGSAEYKEGLALFPAYQDAVGKSQALERDSRRAALIARVPEAIESMRTALVEIPEGQFICFAPSFEGQMCNRGEAFKVPRFRITSCVTEESWKVFLADTGRGDLELAAGDEKCAPPDTLVFDNWPSEAELEAFTAWISSHDGGKWRLPNASEMGLLKEQEASLYPLPVELAAGFHTTLSRPPADRLALNVLNGCDDISISLCPMAYHNAYAVADCWKKRNGGLLEASTRCERKETAEMKVSFYYPEVKGGREYTILRPVGCGCCWCERTEIGAERCRSGRRDIQLSRRN
jgi:hypothetical protein